MRSERRLRLARAALALCLALAWDAQFHMARDAAPAAEPLVRLGLALTGSEVVRLLLIPVWLAIAWSSNVWAYGAAAAFAAAASWSLAAADPANIEHSVVMPECLALALFVALAARRQAKDAQAQAWELGCALIGAMYFLSGVEKLRRSGWSWTEGETVRALVAVESVHAGGLLRSWRWAFASRPAWGRAASGYALAAELVGGPAFVFRRLRAGAGAALVAMHAGIFLLAGIPWGLFPLVVGILSMPESRRDASREEVGA